LLDGFRDQLSVISLGRREFIDKFNPDQIAKIQQKQLRSALELFSRAGAIRDPLVWMIAKSNLYYPITIIAERR
jgi:hypothetical protein